MRKITFAWFDLGYTLLYSEREVPYQKFLETRGHYRAVEEIEKVFHMADKYFMREKRGFFNKEATLYMDEYLTKLNQYLNIHDVISYKEMLQVYKANHFKPTWKAYDYAVTTLENLKSRDIGIGIISNWDHTARPILDQLGLTSYFDEIIISSEINITKPNRAIFELALQKAKVDSSSCIYVGDNYYDDIVGCKQVGIKGKLINRFGRFGIEELDYKAYTGVHEVVAEIL
ncbi:HAD family hydrolase [Fusibacter sp. 3D3]|uniref:HAD family hydrolase n=1 Tax=Fusibacter sp. 3D3 TaxID=1048380 RepID=UPI000853AB76|nr:HAD family hydrolase [Fusibacter sp. 3D3]GAU79483.1 hypothetical protein F3D3_4147 [Fusibacter sp. 3D3]